MQIMDAVTRAELPGPPADARRPDCRRGSLAGEVARLEVAQLGLVLEVVGNLDPAVLERLQLSVDAEALLAPRIEDPAERIRWIWEEEYQNVFPDQVHDKMPTSVMEAPILVLCNHCDNPPCVRVCPTQATWKRDEDGIVMMDMHRCIGCRYCMAACPYGSRSFNWRDPRDLIDTDAQGNFHSEFPTRTRGVVEKCNFCAERLRDGLQPACVEAANQVPGGEGALRFGDLADSGSEVSQVLSSQRTITRRVALGTGPNVFYIV